MNAGNNKKIPTGTSTHGRSDSRNPRRLGDVLKNPSTPVMNSGKERDVFATFFQGAKDVKISGNVVFTQVNSSLHVQPSVGTRRSNVSQPNIDGNKDKEQETSSTNPSSHSGVSIGQSAGSNSIDTESQINSFFKDASNFTITGGNFTSVGGHIYGHKDPSAARRRSGVHSGSNGAPNASKTKIFSSQRYHPELRPSMDQDECKTVCVVSEMPDGTTVLWVPTEESFGDDASRAD